MSTFAGIGNLGAALGGFFNLTGWPDRPPAGPFAAYTDYVSPRFSVALVLAALGHRRRTGEGQYIDQSQIESSLHFLAPALLDYTVNDRVQERVGNRDTQFAPHGIYPTRGEDQWVALIIETDDQWQQLCEMMGQPDLQHDTRFRTPSDRVAAQDALDAIITAWTQDRDMHEIETVLQAHGIPASAVRDIHGLYDDPQLRHRDHFVDLDHPVHGTTTVEGSRFRLSGTPVEAARIMPPLGQDTRHVLENILGYSHNRIAELEAEGVLE